MVQEIFMQKSPIRILLTFLSVVFSYWTSTLDLIEQALSQAAITFFRYDGRLSRAKRYSVLESFTNDAFVQVILVSITCGGQGWVFNALIDHYDCHVTTLDTSSLDLTAANYAFLVEPQWNPMLEEQAMSRVHRLGQTKAVTLVRFIVKDTWEEKIVTVQERKRDLADMIMDGRRLKSGDDGRKQVLVCPCPYPRQLTLSDLALCSICVN